MSDQTTSSPVEGLPPAPMPASILRESAKTDELYPALVGAIAEIHAPDPKDWRTVQVKTQQGPSYSFRYAEYGPIMTVVRPALAKHGLAVMQPIITGPRGPLLLTKVIHKSGQWLESELPLPPIGNNPQAFGGVVTYLKRYALSALLVVAGEEDDDANGAIGSQIQNEPPQRGNGNGRGDQRPQQDGRGMPETAEVIATALARGLMKRAAEVEGVAEGHALLEVWVQRREALETLRGTPAWEALERDIGAALKRSLGTEPAAAFVAALRATEPAHVDAVQEAWEGRWAETLAAMQAHAPATYALLRSHVAQNIRRVRGTEQRGPRDDEGGPPPPPAGPVPDPAPQGGDGGAQTGPTETHRERAARGEAGPAARFHAAAGGNPPSGPAGGDVLDAMRTGKPLPDPRFVPLTMQPNGTPDWAAWAQRMRALLAECGSPGAVKELQEVNADALGRLSKEQPASFGNWIDACVRRTEHVQAEAAAPPPVAAGDDVSFT